MSIWLDVTTILNWHRPAVGIVRVESECARHFLDSVREDVRFCVFRDEPRSYSEVAPRYVRAALQRIGKNEASSGDLVDELGDPAPRFVSNGEEIFREGDVYVSMGLDWDQKYAKYIYQLKKRIGFKVVMFCYDIIPVKLPHLCVGDVASRFAEYFSDVAWTSDEVVCISECSRNDLRDLLNTVGAPVPNLSVVRLGTEIGVDSEASIGASVRAILDRRFLLFVSTIERRKNHETIYRAYTRLVDRGRHDLPLLVFVGMPGWGVGDLLSDLEFDPRTKGVVLQLNHVSDAELGALYRRSLFTVYPSLYEGWGLPVAESLANGKFCLASGAASIPEVGGDLIEYVDPWDVPEWADRLEYWIDHPTELAVREAKIRNEHHAPSWRGTASFVLDACRRLMVTE